MPLFISLTKPSRGTESSEVPRWSEGLEGTNRNDGPKSLVPVLLYFNLARVSSRGAPRSDSHLYTPVLPTFSVTPNRFGLLRILVLSHRAPGTTARSLSIQRCSISSTSNKHWMAYCLINVGWLCPLRGGFGRCAVFGLS